MSDNLWHLYLLRTASGMLYTGITTDVTRRLAQHQAGKGAKALRGKGELTLVFQCEAGDRSTALKLEYRVKQLSKLQKEKLVANQPSSLIALPEVKPG
ncbi:GIY-YIG nuclease superfamily protein [Yersinia aldovae]|uniref:GIY-YIG nuclease family protein n=1 Tax=Yersinia aldovae TaxID=29483 RepID=UPI0005E80616|nr:GIY-YIG nuclease family protein [Yersinia aldovae]CNI05799.1 GIY-YIG nuclease superfamily protein [Yersinia aldovae]